MPQAGGARAGLTLAREEVNDDGDSEGDKGNDDTCRVDTRLPCPPYNDSHHTIHP